MLYLISLFLISGLFVGCLLIMSNNYQLITNNLKTNRFTQVLLLEESSYVMPYVIQKYYSYLVNIRSNIIPSILTTSYWYENTELIKDKELKFQNELRIKILKRISLILALILYCLIIFFWLKYKVLTLSYQFLSSTGFKDQIWSLDIILGVDGLSIPFLCLIGFILPLVYLSNWTTIDHLPTQYYMIIILLEIFLIIVFLVIDLIMFYIFFESILPPLFVLIGLYGASQKFRAGYYLFLYTLFGSLFMLLIFVKMSGDTATSFFIGYTNHNGFTEWQVIIWVILFVSFSVKTPLLPVHIWLPLAHSDANVSGSIILASIVLKLALYGFIRILIAIFFIGTAWLTPFILGLCSISVAYSSFTTIRQFDLKVLVAYSSIAHMASSLLGTFSDTLYGLIGSIIFGLAHGFVSPGLFLIVGAVLYDRCGSRIINYYRGLNAILPFLALIFLILVFGNMGVPLTGNFIGEFLSLLGAYQQNIFIASIGALSIILSAVYSIFMYNRVTSGSISPYIHTIPDIFRKEYYILIPLILLTIILGIYPSFISTDIEFGLSNFLFITSFPFFSNSKRNLNSSSIDKTKNNLNLSILENSSNNLIIESKKNKLKNDLIKGVVPWEDKPSQPNWPWDEDEDDDPVYDPWPPSDPEDDDEENVNDIIRAGSPDSSLDSDWGNDSDLDDESELGDIIDYEEEDLFEEDDEGGENSEEEYSDSDSDSDSDSNNSSSSPSSSDPSSSGPSSSAPSSGGSSSSAPSSSVPSSSSSSSNDSSSIDNENSNFNIKDSFTNNRDNIDTFINENEAIDEISMEYFYDSINNENFIIDENNANYYLNIFRLINQEINNILYSGINNIVLIKDILILLMFSILIILSSYMLYLKINYLIKEILKLIFNVRYNYNSKLKNKIKNNNLYIISIFSKNLTDFWYVISIDRFKYIKKKLLILLIFIFFPWLITTYPHLLGIDIEFGLSNFLFTGNLWGTMAALMFEKTEVKSKTLHKNANNPHTTPVVDKAVPDIEGNSDKKDQSDTDSVKTDNKSDSANAVNESNTIKTENKLISTDSTKPENLKDLEKDKNREDTGKNENVQNADKNENAQNVNKNENIQNADKNENTENNLKKESTDSIESKQESATEKSETNSVKSEDDVNELGTDIQDINLNDQSKIVGLPFSKEGTSRFVGLKDYENQPVDAEKLRNRIEKLPKIIEEEKFSYIQDKNIDKYSSMTPEEYKKYCEDNSTKPSTNPNIPQDKIINVVRWPLHKENDSDDDSSRELGTQGSVSRTTTSPESSSSSTTRSVDTSFVDQKLVPIHGLNDSNLDYSIYNLLKMNFSPEDIIFFINQINLNIYNVSVLNIFILFITFIFFIMRLFTLYLYIKSNIDEINIILLNFKCIYYLNLKNTIKKYLLKK